MNIEAENARNYGTNVQATRPVGLQRRRDRSGGTRGPAVVRPVPRYVSDSRARDRASIVSLKQTPNAAPESAIDWSGVVTQRIQYSEATSFSLRVILPQRSCTWRTARYGCL